MHIAYVLWLSKTATRHQLSARMPDEIGAMMHASRMSRMPAAEQVNSLLEGEADAAGDNMSPIVHGE